MWKGMAPS
jgi:hypothetical protein